MTQNDNVQIMSIRNHRTAMFFLQSLEESMAEAEKTFAAGDMEASENITMNAMLRIKFLEKELL